MKGILLVLAVICVAAVALVTIRKPMPAHEPGDDDVIEQLRIAGSNLSRPHPIDFYVYVPSKEAALRISGALSGQGFQVKVEPSAAGDSKWLALASKHVVPTSAALAQLRRDLTVLAESEHGEYDGWEAAVVK